MALAADTSRRRALYDAQPATQAATNVDASQSISSCAEHQLDHGVRAMAPRAQTVPRRPSRVCGKSARQPSLQDGLREVRCMEWAWRRRSQKSETGLAVVERVQRQRGCTYRGAVFASEQRGLRGRL